MIGNSFASVVLSLTRASLLIMFSGISVAQGAMGAPAQPQAALRVVASFSILGDMVKEIGGEYVVLSTIVGPNGDAHAFEPTPKDAKALSQAQVLVINGLDFEGWLPRLLQASGFKGEQILASEGVKPLAIDSHAHSASHAGHADHDAAPGDADPHAWQSLRNGMLYAKNIANGLARADPAHKAYYQKRAAAYIAKMEKLDVEIKDALGAIPAARRKIITSHDAFGYFGKAYGVQFISAVGFSSEAEPSAKDVAAIIDKAKKDHISAIFVENTSNPRLVQQIARETGAAVGGTLYSDALGPMDEPAGTYLGMFSWNAGQLIYALKPHKKK